jgi:hypothetical protein
VYEGPVSALDEPSWTHPRLVQVGVLARFSTTARLPGAKPPLFPHSLVRLDALLLPLFGARIAWSLLASCLAETRWEAVAKPARARTRWFRVNIAPMKCCRQTGEADRRWCGFVDYKRFAVV